MKDESNPASVCVYECLKNLRLVQQTPHCGHVGPEKKLS